jgi:hypothetical protein
MPKNCSADVQRVIEYVDKTFTNGTKAQQAALKANWGLGAVEHLDDVAGARAYMCSIYIYVKRRY